ncbi:emp24p/erv25p- protein [Malassezia yamatoensis]|uniref:Emp24p/erv25p- protein n=1 Tax=Malassezia yamatoensis TaxID=253288 RepID=A0AAJ6CH69_9BASI|nr:emp24p/erv25p- protein [Malassezia yamatoensis]
MILPRTRVSLVWLFVFCLTIARSVQSLYFYFEAGSNKCFFEQLPKDTIVVVHYYTEEWDDVQSHYDIPTDLGIGIVVKHLESNHVLVSAQGKPEGKFAFTSHEPGRHEVCVQTEYHGSRMSHGHLPEVRMHLEVVFGDSHRPNTESDREHAFDLLTRARALNAKMSDLRKEQQYQREREMSFRDMSEATNARAFWCILVQILALILACIWQLSNLRTFFEDKKLR